MRLYAAAAAAAVVNGRLGGVLAPLYGGENGDDWLDGRDDNGGGEVAFTDAFRLLGIILLWIL